MVFLEVKECALHLYVESRNPEWSQRSKGRGHLRSKPEVVELNITKAEPLFINFETTSWSQRNSFGNCRAGGIIASPFESLVKVRE